MNPFATLSLPSATPKATRAVKIFGGEVDLVWLPERARRRCPPQVLLHADRAPRILAEERLWQCDRSAAVLTPNRYPFARRAALLWSARPQREADAELIALALELAEPFGGTALLNTLGAAATQPRAHLHLVHERLGFLAGLATVPARLEHEDPALAAVDVVRLAPPFPGLVLGVRGARAARAAAAARLLALRVSAAANLVSDGTTTWFVPRRCETPAPHVSRPLGCAELWGRFCYEDEAEFAAADAASLAAAWAAALLPPA
ncbi:MAG: hypothetical protein R3F56_22490 [Planctomycetota bacterium]